MSDPQMPDLGELLKQAQEMQQQLVAAQSAVAEQEIEGVAGGGAVRIVATGGMEFVSVHIAPEALEHIVFTLQPSLTLIDSPFPVFTVWFANQFENAPPVSQSVGRECGMVRIRTDRVEVARLAPDLFSFLSALAAGAALGEAMTKANVDERRLTEILAFAFNSSLVCSSAPTGK